VSTDAVASVVTVVIYAASASARHCVLFTSLTYDYCYVSNNTYCDMCMHWYTIQGATTTTATDAAAGTTTAAVTKADATTGAIEKGMSAVQQKVDAVTDKVSVSIPVSIVILQKVHYMIVCVCTVLLKPLLLCYRTECYSYNPVCSVRYVARTVYSVHATLMRPANNFLCTDTTTYHYNTCNCRNYSYTSCQMQ
jgi:hypothetical protein